ncbi:hypothetical protein DUNSADRAFT_10921 [Dunaliella salina]|uniref:Uncharacterized protein n=1 Tax=Dunaliella salina TaxID=3046 RepID=A0ABQ7GEH4_DUNSA|nr:hypothetical protein DUNSADRAFT_10921 [Dunaliella salina]|eukprot:KAF5833000.1 hypothetical protein DUNSADRAFT_10921 [Dunaliella salina]
MKPVIFDSLRQTLGHAAARPDNIQWCLTLPAMWSDAAKQAMREAALRAGLIRNIDSEALSIILEPEAAVLHALENRAPPLSPGETVMILDCGGGTVDTTVHCCKQGRGQAVLLAEAACADGALCGAEYVDQHFLDHFREAVGADAFNEWMQSHPAELAVVMSKWEAIKRSFGGTDASTPEYFDDEELGQISAVSSRVPIMPGLHALMSEDDNNNLRCEQASDSDLELTMDCLQAIFSGPVQSTIDLASKQLDALSTKCSKVLMVGGFASSPHLQACVRDALGTRVDAIIVPPHNYAAVLNGAVLYGCNPELITARRSRMSYGIKACAPYEEDQLVDRDEGIEHFFIPLYASQTRADIELFATTSKDTKYVVTTDENMKSVGTMHIDLPPSTKEDRVITVTLTFGKTEITAAAKDESSGLQASTRIRFAYRSA